jgi:hypothetical protein
VNLFFHDFETFSEADLTSVGAFKYAEHSSTETLCLAYAINDSPVRLWLPGAGPLAQLDQYPDTFFVAHNCAKHLP